MPNLPTPHPPISEADYVRLMGRVLVEGGNRSLKKSFKRSATRFVLSHFVRCYADLLLLTGGWRTDDPHHAIKVFTEGSGAVGACWHGNLVAMLLAYRSLCRTVKLSARYMVLSSESNDGELVARLFRDCGGNNVRGSVKKRGAGAVIGSVNELKQGANLFITIDGPRGPKHQPKGGALHMARLSGRPIIPVAGSFGRMFQFRGSWDEFQLPIPFGCFTFHVGEPLFVPANATGDKGDEYLEKLRERMQEVTARAEREPVSVIGLGKPRQRR